MKFHENIIETISFYRGCILDAVEDHLGDSFKESQLRSKLLKYLGDRGLEGKILELLRRRNKEGDSDE